MGRRLTRLAADAGWRDPEAGAAEAWTLGRQSYCGSTMPDYDPLGQAEQEAGQILASALAGYSGLTERTFNAFGICLGAAPEVPIATTSLARRVATVLLVRLSNDLRCVALLGLRGYALQAASVAATMYEVAHVVAFVGSDELRAASWADHPDPTKPFLNTRELTRHVIDGLKVDEPEAAIERSYQIYRQLCLAKHANPLLQKEHGHYAEESADVAMNGPDTSEDATRVATFALEYASRFSLIALASFVSNHVPTSQREGLSRRIRELNDEAMALDSAARQKFGTEDPFPGEW